MRRLREVVAVWAARRMIGRCDAIGAHVHVNGVPFIENRGVLSIGADVRLDAEPVRSHLVTGPDGRISVGDRVVIGHGVSMCAYAEIEIGAGTTIGPFAVIVDVDFHEVGDRGSVGEARAIHIGRDVRIGPGAVILRGANIGDGAVIAPNSVVSRRIPARARVAGVPARPILVAVR